MFLLYIPSLFYLCVYACIDDDAVVFLLFLLLLGFI